MSFTSGTYGQAPQDGPPRRHQCFGFGCKPMELIAIILGFIVYWPIGLAILLAKIWQVRSAYSGDLPSFIQSKMQQKVREKWEQKMSGHWGCGASRQDFRERARRWRADLHSSGNLAFDDWREAELARLDEERQKLLAAEREFGEFMNDLRRAKDREEFDRFMAARGNRPSDGGAPNQPAS